MEACMPFPSRCTEANRTALISAKRAGMNDAEAAQRAGISQRALYHWYKHGREGIAPYAALIRDMGRALYDYRMESPGNRTELVQAA